MELFSLIVSLVAELAKLARVLLADGMRFMALRFFGQDRSIMNGYSEPL